MPQIPSTYPEDSPINRSVLALWLIKKKLLLVVLIQVLVSYVGSAAAIHDSTGHSFLGFIARGLAGAFVGAAVEEAVTRREGVLYTVENDQRRFNRSGFNQ